MSPAASPFPGARWDYVNSRPRALSEDRCDGNAVSCPRPPAYIIGDIKACREHIIDVLDCYLLDPPSGFARLDSMVVSAVPTP